MMIVRSFVAAALILAASVALATKVTRPDIEAEVRAFARAFDRAQLDGDRAALEEMIADDLVFIRGSGKLAGKRELIESFTSSGLELEPFEIVNPTYVQLGPDAAIVGGETTLRGTENGEAISEHFRFADTFLRENGRWRAVHVQVTMIR